MDMLLQYGYTYAGRIRSDAIRARRPGFVQTSPPSDKRVAHPQHVCTLGEILSIVVARELAFVFAHLVWQQHSKRLVQGMF